ncbi:sulfatase-like hydrolase/transferase [Avibacterium endocarditidis]|nr:sulfatase-like hydrolase/transferase [Avibacterium endocarditidis]
MKKTNVVLIVADDLGYWALGCYGNKEAITPNIDKLAQQGKKFNDFFCVSPVCSPARASIFTGRIPSQHGIHDWLEEWENGATTEHYLKGQSTFVDRLKQHNYLCAMSGKWHLGMADTPQCGFDYWYSHQRGGGPYFNAPMYRDGILIEEPDYITDKITDYGLDFIEKVHNADQPFFSQSKLYRPHSPWDRKNHPQEILDLYADCQFASCPRDPYHPWKIYETFEGDEQERLEVLRGYFAALTAMDFNIGRIITALEEKGILENTLIIFTSDNGMNMGHHGIFGKGNGTSPVNMFDTSVKVPFILYHKNHLLTGEIDNLLSHYDFRHTLLEYLNISDEDQAQVRYPGKSFSTLLKQEPTDSREENHLVIFDEYGPTRMIRNRSFKYIHRYPDGPYEFYDLRNDPDEHHNQIDNPDYQQQIAQMRRELNRWFNQYINKEIDGATLPVYGGGQRTLAGEWGGYAENTFNKYTSHFVFSADGKLQQKSDVKVKEKIQ